MRAGALLRPTQGQVMPATAAIELPNIGVAFLVGPMLDYAARYWQ